jgi:hypothetical protein
MTAGFTAFAGEVLYEDFSGGQGHWVIRGGDSFFSNETAYAAANANGQPGAVYQDFDPVTLQDGDTLRLTVEVATDDTTARNRDIRVGLCLADPIFTGSSETVSGYSISVPSGGSGTDPRIAWVQDPGGGINFFNSQTALVGDAALDNNVWVSETPKTWVVQVDRVGSNLVFSGSLDGTAYGTAVTASVPNIVSNYTFNTVGLAHVYGSGYKAAYDNVKVEYNPNPETIELFTTTFDDALQLSGLDTPINMGGTNNNLVALSDLSFGAGVGGNYFHVRTDGDFTNYAGTTVINNTGSNLTSAVATDCYYEFTCAGGVAYESLSFSMIKFGFTQLAGVTVRSSLDSYTADLLTVTDETSAGSYRGTVDLAAVSGMDSAGSVTFRFYLYDQYDGTAGNRKMGVDSIRITGVPIAKQFFVTDFESATQAGGVDTPIDMAGSVYSNITISALTNGAGMENYYLRSSVSADGVFASEVAGSNIASNLASAVSNEEYCEFALSSTEPVDLNLIRFEMAKNGFAQLAGITLRSSADGFTSDLLTVTNDTSAGRYPTFVDLSSNADFDEISSVTFRFYLYDEYGTQNNRYFGVDNIDVSGVFSADALPPSAAVLTITSGSGTVTVSASNLSTDAQNQLQSRASLASGTWGDVGSAVTGVAATNWVISTSNPAEFYQVESSN